MSTASGISIHSVRDVTVINFHDTSLLDMLHIQQISDQLYPLVEKQDRRKLLLDFTTVEFMSSAALGVLLSLRGKLGKVKGRMVICGLRPDLKNIFSITALDKMFEFFQNEEEALNSFGAYTKDR